MEIGTEEYRRLEVHARRIAVQQSEAIGLAAIRLDCGCIHYCGVSFTGDPVGPLTRLSVDNAPAAICLKCRRPDDRLSHRIEDRLMIWPGRPEEWPEPELRKLIAHKVFGDNYRETAG